jgi:N-methylhydantoinase B/oxoprolinase/acetone carboxylase alpha subunit
LVKNLSPQLQKIAHPSYLDSSLKKEIQKHLAQGDLIIAMSGGGGGSLDEWLRKEFA